MSSFTTPLIVKVLDKHKFELFKSFTFRLGKDAITVPRGFVTDFASVPKAFWSIIPPYGKHTKAAVLHDYLYQYHGFVSGGQIISYTRKESDQIFLRAMETLGVNQIKRWVMYQGVRIFGSHTWKK